MKQNTTNCGTGIESFTACVFNPFDNRGFVLNTKGFPGAIQIEGSTFGQNMAYIADYVIQENVPSDTYLTPSTIKYSDFEAQTGQLNFKICDLRSFRASYIFQKLADPNGDFDDLDFAQNYESVSTLMIIENKGPLIIKNNTFTDNIGTMGGAIHVFSPDFESNKEKRLYGNNTLPYIYITENTF